MIHIKPFPPIFGVGCLESFAIAHPGVEASAGGQTPRPAALLDSLRHGYLDSPFSGGRAMSSEAPRLQLMLHATSVISTCYNIKPGCHLLRRSWEKPKRINARQCVCG